MGRTGVAGVLAAIRTAPRRDPAAQRRVAEAAKRALVDHRLWETADVARVVQYFAREACMVQVVGDLVRVARGRVGGCTARDTATLVHAAFKYAKAPAFEADVARLLPPLMAHVGAPAVQRSLDAAALSQLVCFAVKLSVLPAHAAALCRLVDRAGADGPLRDALGRGTTEAPPFLEALSAIHTGRHPAPALPLPASEGDDGGAAMAALKAAAERTGTAVARAVHDRARGILRWDDAAKLALAWARLRVADPDMWARFGARLPLNGRGEKAEVRQLVAVVYSYAAVAVPHLQVIRGLDVRLGSRSPKDLAEDPARVPTALDAFVKLAFTPARHGAYLRALTHPTGNWAARASLRDVCDGVAAASRLTLLASPEDVAGIAKAVIEGTSFEAADGAPQEAPKRTNGAEEAAGEACIGGTPQPLQPRSSGLLLQALGEDESGDGLVLPGWADGDVEEGGMDEQGTLDLQLGVSDAPEAAPAPQGEGGEAPQKDPGAARAPAPTPVSDIVAAGVPRDSWELITPPRSRQGRAAVLSAGAAPPEGGGDAEAPPDAAAVGFVGWDAEGMPGLDELLEGAMRDVHRAGRARAGRARAQQRRVSFDPVGSLKTWGLPMRGSKPSAPSPPPPAPTQRRFDADVDRMLPRLLWAFAVWSPAEPHDLLWHLRGRAARAVRAAAPGDAAVGRIAHAYAKHRVKVPELAEALAAHDRRFMAAGDGAQAARPRAPALRCFDEPEEVEREDADGWRWGERYAHVPVAQAKWMFYNAHALGLPPAPYVALLRHRFAAAAESPDAAAAAATLRTLMCDCKDLGVYPPPIFAAVTAALRGGLWRRVADADPSGAALAAAVTAYGQMNAVGDIAGLLDTAPVAPALADAMHSVVGRARGPASEW
eukprot:TRINITY_DN280_c2_g1_i2.p1 TRINITY_DN280_c2_g1~~TRINITY_DN280_c2_g1_i2.p1  ORF type:complete len:885 (+),score=238.60 TRINITY_DN280_c2_g1_i2:142-2796(+)